jgi:hypothetical protein
MQTMPLRSWQHHSPVGSGRTGHQVFKSPSKVGDHVDSSDGAALKVQFCFAGISCTWGESDNMIKTGRIHPLRSWVVRTG